MPSAEEFRGGPAGRASSPETASSRPEHSAERSLAMADALAKLLDKPIAFHRCFVNLCGSVSAGIMLSQGWYWSYVSEDEMRRDGWFYKTEQEWQKETGLTRREQQRARAILRKTGVWEENRKGVPARMFFRVDRNRVLSKLGVPSCTVEGNQLHRTVQQDAPYGATFKGTENTSETTTESKRYSLCFHLFWEAWPNGRHVEKSSAERAFGKIEEGTNFNFPAIMAGLDRWKAYWKACATDPKYIPYPAKFLKNRKWEDEVPVIAQKESEIGRAPEGGGVSPQTIARDKERQEQIRKMERQNVR